MRLIDDRLLFKALAALAVLMLLSPAARGDAEVWSYDVIIEHNFLNEAEVPSIVRGELSKSEMKKLGTAIKQNVNLNYIRTDDGVCIPTFSVNPVKRMVRINRFCVNETYCLYYRSAPGSVGQIEIMPAKFASGYLTPIDLALFMGPGSLSERFENLLLEGIPPDVFNPHNYKLEPQGGELHIYVSNRDEGKIYEKNGRIYLEWYKEGSDSRMRFGYQEIADLPTKSIEEEIPIGTPVGDSRRGEADRAKYLWTGKVPPLEELGSTKSTRGDRKQLTGLVWGGVGITALGAIYLVVRSRRARSQS